VYRHTTNSKFNTNTPIICRDIIGQPRRRYPHFDVVVGLAWSDDLESYAGGRIVTGRVSQDGQVKGDDPDRKGYPGPPGWGLGVGLTTPLSDLFRNPTWSLGEVGGMEEEGWECHGPKTGRSAIEEEDKRRQTKWQTRFLHYTFNSFTQRTHSTPKQRLVSTTLPVQPPRHGQDAFTDLHMCTYTEHYWTCLSLAATVSLSRCVILCRHL
jgi:hypothetical protein